MDSNVDTPQNLKPRHLAIQFGLRTLLAVVFTASMACWVWSRVGHDILYLGMGDLLVTGALFAIGTAVAWGLSVFVLPQCLSGLSLHVARGLAFGLLAAPSFIRARCVGVIVMPVYWLCWLAPGQILVHPRWVLATIVPGVLVVGGFAMAVSLCQAKKPGVRC